MIVEVPQSHTDTEGGTLGLEVARTPARVPSERIGALYVDFGGPGISGLQQGVLMAKTLPESILDRFDIITSDRRGLGKSGGFDCLDELAELDAVSPSAESVQSIEEYEKAARSYVATCTEASDGLLPYINSREAAKDLDDIRSALNEESWSLLTISYGTVLGQLYREQYPERVRSVILDGVSNLSRTGPEAADSTVLSLETATNEGPEIPRPEYTDAEKKAFEAYAITSSTLPLEQAYYCSDYVWPDNVTDLLKEATEQLVLDFGACAVWENQNAVTHSAVDSDVPMMIMNSVNDPRTSYSGAMEVAKYYSSPIITVSGSWHGLFGADECATKAGVTFLETALSPVSSSC